MLGLKLIHVSKRGHRPSASTILPKYLLYQTVSIKMVTFTTGKYHSSHLGFWMFFSRCGGSYMTKIFLSEHSKLGLSTEISNIVDRKFLLLAPWSHTRTCTFSPISDSFRIALNVMSFSLSPEIVPELRKYPMHGFYFCDSPRTMIASAWFAMYFVCPKCP